MFSIMIGLLALEVHEIGKSQWKGQNISDVGVVVVTVHASNHGSAVFCVVPQERHGNMIVMT